LSVEVSVDVSAALGRLSRHRFEAVVVDLAFGKQAIDCFQQVRASAQTAVQSSSHSLGVATTRPGLSSKDLTLCSKGR
jgi:hypothetical protein